uniref:Uncharacterized protein n=1 Tax=Arabidopsis thaliana TaxID=3702 RepID=Q56YC0_ARATH|nr:hypothetical protein [Arabidopsis thaliana]
MSHLPLLHFTLVANPSRRQSKRDMYPLDTHGPDKDPS